LLVFVFGYWLAVIIRRHFSLTIKRVSALYLWHAVFSFVYLFYVLNWGGDAIGYYRMSFSPDLEFGLGTLGVRLLTSFFTQGLGFSFAGTFLVFQMFGFIGLVAFDASLREVTYDKSRNIKLLATLIVFLPSVSFWSSSIGKDALSFMAMGLALWAALNLKRRILLMVFAILVMLFVRPHIAGMMVIGLSGSFVLQRKVSFGQRLFFGIAAFVAAAVLVPLGLNYAGISDGASGADVMEYIEGRQGQNLSGGSSLDISGMSPPMQLFTYLFRPLPFEAHSLFALAASVDNIILLSLFIMGGRAILTKRLPSHLSTHNRMFLWIYSLLAWAILAMTTANLGIAMRQKWMFTPMLIFLLISVIGKPRRVTASGTSHPVACSAPVKHGRVTKI